MDFLSVVLLAISSNLDNLGVGISYGMRKVRIPWQSNLLIAFITSTGTLLSMTFGSLMSYAMDPAVASTVGAFIIMGAGVWVIFLDRYQGRAGRERNGPVSIYDVPQSIARIFSFLKEPLRADLDASGTISLYEGTLLGLALTINNVSSGIGAGMAGVNAVATAVLVLILSLIMLSGGIVLGSSYAARWLGDKAGLVGGLLLIMIGIFECLH
jgi:putative sporulation protein YtaF